MTEENSAFQPFSLLISSFARSLLAVPDGKMAMEQTQELQLLDKSMMAPKLDESIKHEPEMWYKVVHNAGADNVAESPLQSEDELNMSHGRCSAKPALDVKPLTDGQTRVQKQYHDHRLLRELPYRNRSPTSLPN